MNRKTISVERKEKGFIGNFLSFFCVHEFVETQLNAWGWSPNRKKVKRKVTEAVCIKCGTKMVLEYTETKAEQRLG